MAKECSENKKTLFQASPAIPAIFGTVGLALVIMAEEFLSYQIFEAEPFGEVDTYLVFCASQAIAAAVFAGFDSWSKNEEGGGGEPSKPIRLIAVLGILAVLIDSLVCLAVLKNPSAIVFFLCAISVGLLCVKVFYLLFLSEISSYWLKRILFGSCLIQSLFSSVVVLAIDADMIGVAILVSSLCGLAGAGCLAVCWRRRSVLAASYKPTRLSSSHGSALPLILGLGAIMMTLGFMNPFLVYEEISTDDLSLMIFATHLVAMLLFGLCIFRLDDESYSISCRTILTLVCIALLAYFAESSAKTFAFCICASVVGFVEMITFFAMADYSSYSNYSKLQVFGVYYCVIRISMTLGLLLDELSVAGPLHQVIGLILGVVMIIVALWVMTPETLNKFFWGKAVETAIDAAVAVPDEALLEESEERENDGGISVTERSAEIISKRYGLTPREQEVLELFSVGRSATFIAEELTLSSNTVRKHVAHIYTKCDVHSKQELLTLMQDCQGTCNSQGVK